ncbi:MAG: ATP-binding cassette domain-containing protein [Chloroflexota bacterium]
MSNNATITLKSVKKSFVGRTVVDIDSLTLGTYPIEGLIGPNGAGKTTLMSLITGKLPADQGEILFLPQDESPINLSAYRLEEIARMGLVRTNQIIQDFDSLSIRDSLLLSLATPLHEKFFKLFSGRQLQQDVEKEIDFYLDYFPFENSEGHALSAGEKKLLDIIRCLLLKPKFLLMDEPTAGLPHDLTKKVMELMQHKAEEEGLSILIVEHDLDLIWEVCEYVHFLAEGKLMTQGTPEEIRSNQTVAEKYMGAVHV